MARIKIAHVAHSVGGVDVYLRLVAGNIDNTQFENVVVHGNLDTNKPFFGVGNEQLKEFKTTVVREISPIKDIKAIIDTYKFLKKERPNIIHAHSAKGGIIGKIAGYFLGIKVLYTPHAFSYLSSNSKIKRRIFLFIERVFANHNSLLLATSNSERNRAIEEVGYKPENAIVFNNSVEIIKEIQPLTIEKTWPDDYICTVGRPSFQKNIELMVRVVHELNKEKNIHLIVMGVGHHVGQLESVKNLIKELNMSDKVTLLNWTDREDVFNIISNSKLYISTSRYEGLPYSIVESLALSKPCVVSNCDGNKDLIKDGFNGYVIQDGKVETYKQKILKLLIDETLRNEFSSNALISFNESFNISKNIKKLEEIYAAYSAHEQN